ncbi:hypothetical protein SAMN05443549_103252 [Flavobacterium fluvii]|uniref:DUF4870 domain-containing protein n=1 Tax=Flavobacterium fluvii TaxID=468056 RepID=A0A1M5IV26_9FLAO|nr:DUF4870 domain-containing protein [Flavobacterium fluvii]SHG32177.1 hypothetical protein SAMN05443549_103252 [Flavobacterium fluvii]
METTNEKNLAAITHLSALSQYCIPFGNYIFPILIWSTKKDKSEYIDFNGKQILNFQLSMFLYTLLLLLIAVPILIVTIFNTIPIDTMINDVDAAFNHLSIENISGIIIVAIIAIFAVIGLKIAEFFLIIYASLKASNGERYKYPLTIPFIK